MILLAALAVRVLAGCDGLWLDEIWTLAILGQVITPLDILTSLHQENNHYLNTFCVWLIGLQPTWILYRIPSMLAGVASVFVAGAIARRRSPRAATLAMLLTAGSYLLIHYSSEARGYAFAVCFALLALYFQELVFDRTRTWAPWGVAASAIAGILSQPVFLSFYGALVVWAGWKSWAATSGRRRLARDFWKAHLPPLLFFGWLYAVDLSQTQNAGGPIYPLGEVLLETLSLTAGGPMDETSIPFWGGLLLAGFVGSLVVLRKCDRDFCVLALLAGVVFPLLLMLLLGRKEIYPRYFIISVALFYLTLALAADRLWTGRPFRRTVCVLFVIGILVGNATHVVRLVSLGRGGYTQAMQYLAENTTGREITVTSDFDFRNQMVLAFYSQYLPEDKQLVYVRQQELKASGPEWFFVHDLALEPRFATEFRSKHGPVYRRERVWLYAGLSGWSWALYRKVP